MERLIGKLTIEPEASKNSLVTFRHSKGKKSGHIKKNNERIKVVRVYGDSKQLDTQIHHATIAHKAAHLQ